MVMKKHKIKPVNERTLLREWLTDMERSGAATLPIEDTPTSGTRFQWRKKYDCEVKKGRITQVIEAKIINGFTFNSNEILPHQHEALQRIYDVCEQPYITPFILIFVYCSINTDSGKRRDNELVNFALANRLVEYNGKTKFAVLVEYEYVKTGSHDVMDLIRNLSWIYYKRHNEWRGIAKDRLKYELC